MKKLTFIIIALIVFAAGFILSKYWYSDKSIPEILKELTRSSSEVEVVIEKESTPIVSETSPSKPIVVMESSDDVAEALKVAFMHKYSKTAAEVTVTVSKLDETHAAGGVRFGPETVGGGWFLAAKEDGAWKIVDDGNGIVLCSLVEPYDFPVSMVSACYDEDTSAMVEF